MIAAVRAAKDIGDVVVISVTTSGAITPVVMSQTTRRHRVWIVHINERRGPSSRVSCAISTTAVHDGVTRAPNIPEIRNSNAIRWRLRFVSLVDDNNSDG